MKISQILTTTLIISSAITIGSIAQADASDTAASFYEQYKNNVNGIPLPVCAESSTELTREEIQQIVLEHQS